MTMNRLWDKLRKKNSGNYRQFQFCITFAVMLISSFWMMMWSPLIQNTLPVGGDSRTQVYMIFGIAVAGCTIFIIYASHLFFRYKSREVGVFLALGTDKGKLTRTLAVEMAKLVGGCSLLGIAAGSIFSLGIGKVFELLASKANDNRFAFSAAGFLGALGYAAVIFLIVLLLVFRFMKKSNVMEIINEQRRQEPLKKAVSSSYLITGFVLLAVGLFFAMILPRIVVNLFQHWLGIWTNLFYLLVLLGLYRIMVYSIASHKRGRNPQKYYNNIISYGMLKFQGASIVRNMLVITLLIMGGLFALYYIPMNTGQAVGYDEYEAMYSYYSPADSGEITADELKNLAQKHDVEIQNYREGQFIDIVGDGMKRDDIDENGNLIEEYREKFATYECISVSEYEKLTGEKHEVADGSYYLIQKMNSQEGVYNRFDNFSKLYFGEGDEFLEMKYQGNVIYQCLVRYYGFDVTSRILISDGDYQTLRGHIDESQVLNMVLFDTDITEEALAFANELYKEFTQRMSDGMRVPFFYDRIMAEQEGEEYGYNFPAEYDAENPAKEPDWKFIPQFVILEQANGLVQRAVFLLLFLYVAVICLAAVGIISYTRSQSVGISSRQVFEDVKKLGADRSYLSKLLKVQVKKVYVLPTVVGCIGMAAFELLMLWINDGRYTANEIKSMGTMMIMTLCVIGYQYLMYRISLKKVTEMLSI